MSERLQYAHLEGGNLVVQLDGGRASQPLTSGLPVEQVVAHLRLLAATLERDAAQRQPPAGPLADAMPVRFYANGREFAVRGIAVESEPGYFDPTLPFAFVFNGQPTMKVDFLDAATAAEFAAAAWPRVEWRCDLANGTSRSGRGVATIDGKHARISHGPPAISHGDRK
jgi:hypothetical protein